ncbi:MAG: PLP-dependent aminotransferase family protein [Verrucomicrobia bacterium]|nr:PLP-dependent aminotransferase family protein [Verrucomicrobiota bacterium]
MMEPQLFQAKGRLIDFMRQADQGGLINLAAGVPSLDGLPVEGLRAAMERGWERDGARMYGYHHPEGDPRLRDLLASRIQARGAGVSGSGIVTVTGCTQGLQILLSILVQPGDVVAVESPAYYGLLELLSVAGVRVLPLEVRSAEGIDLDAAEELFAQWKPRCLIVCGALSNPSGATIEDGDRERLVGICREHGVRLIEDDIYGELVDGVVPRSFLSWDDGSVVSYVTSFSKTVAPGLRVGFCVPGTLHEEYAARKCQQDLHSAVPTEVILREFLEAGEFDPHLERLRAGYMARRGLALAVMAATFPAGIRVTPPRGGYMLWVELPRVVDLEWLRIKAAQARVVFAGGEVFFVKSPGKTFLRLNCAKVSEAELVEGLTILGSILKTSG